MITRDDLAKLVGLPQAEIEERLRAMVADLDLSSLPPWHRNKTADELLRELLRQVKEIGENQSGPQD